METKENHKYRTQSGDVVGPMFSMDANVEGEFFYSPDCTFQVPGRPDVFPAWDEHGRFAGSLETPYAPYDFAEDLGRASSSEILKIKLRERSSFLIGAATILAILATLLWAPA